MPTDYQEKSLSQRNLITGNLHSQRNLITGNLHPNTDTPKIQKNQIQWKTKYHINESHGGRQINPR